MKHKDTLILNWIYILCFLGGFLNTITAIKYASVVSHFTGSLATMAIEIANRKLELVGIKFFLVIISFVFGSALAGYVIDRRDFDIHHRYGDIFLILGSFLVFLYFYSPNSLILYYYLPFMMGMQNGIFSTYKGVVLRTTRVTGNITDAGVYLGHALKGEKEALWKLKLSVMMVVYFFIGGYAGIELYFLYENKVFLILGLSYVVTAYIYFFYRKKNLMYLASHENDIPFK